MKARTIALLWLMASVMLAAQTVAPAPKPGPAAKPAPTQAKPAPAKPAATAAKPATTAKPAATAKSAAKTAPAQKPKPAAAKAPAQKSAKPAAAKPAVAKSKAGTKTPAAAVKRASKRDPFISPVREAGGLSCTSGGKKCLVIDTIVLKGIARTQQGNIALVESATRKASYFLRENDPVFNGFVIKITGDSIVFRENVVDAVGRKSMREVVKKVVAPVV